MALIDCPGCGKRISDTRPACPNCGWDITGIKRNVVNSPLRSEARGENTEIMHPQKERRETKNPGVRGSIKSGSTGGAFQSTQFSFSSNPIKDVPTSRPNTGVAPEVSTSQSGATSNLTPTPPIPPTIPTQGRISEPAQISSPTSSDAVYPSNINHAEKVKQNYGGEIYDSQKPVYDIKNTHKNSRRGLLWLLLTVIAIGVFIGGYFIYDRWLTNQYIPDDTYWENPQTTNNQTETEDYY